MRSPKDELDNLMVGMNRTFNSLLFTHDILGYVIKNFHDGEFIINRQDFAEYRCKYIFSLDDLEDVFILKVITIDDED